MGTTAEVSLFEEGESVGTVIRRVFTELGGNVPARVVTQTIIDRQLLPAVTFSGFLFKGLVARVRLELAKLTAEHLPFAQPTSHEEGAVWKQLDLFTADEAFALVSRRAKSLHDDHAELVRLHAWCLAKFGDAPDIPELRETETA